MSDSLKDPVLSKSVNPFHVRSKLVAAYVTGGFHGTSNEFGAAQIRNREPLFCLKLMY